MQEHWTVRLCLFCAIAIATGGVLAHWSFRVTLFAGLVSLVLGLALARLIAFITARRAREQAGQKGSP